MSELKTPLSIDGPWIRDADGLAIATFVAGSPAVALVHAANRLPKCVEWINEVVGDHGLRCDRDVVDRGRNLKAALLSECEPTRAADGGGDEV